MAVWSDDEEPQEEALDMWTAIVIGALVLIGYSVWRNKRKHDKG